MLDEGAHARVLSSGIILGDYEEGGAGERCSVLHTAYTP